MKKNISFISLLVFSLIVTSTTYAADSDGVEPWADSYKEFSQGQRKDGENVKSIRSNPSAAVGKSESAGLDQESVYTESQFLSLGFGGKITLIFTNSIVDGIGDDLMVYEVTGPGAYPIEKAKVEVSANGTDFIEIGEIERDGSLDLNGKTSCVQYVRITDTSDKSIFGSGDTVDGFDLDGVKALNSDESTCDDDIDGIYDDQDMCPSSISDTWKEDVLGVNRWMFDNGAWLTKNPKTKDLEAKENPYDSDLFKGCTCKDILNVIKDKTDANLEGHYKYGCSKSILEDWSKGEYSMGTVLVPAGGIDYSWMHSVNTSFSSKSGTDYKIIASGTFIYMSSALPTFGDADAEYSNRPSWTYGPGWILGDDIWPDDIKHGLDLTIDGNNIEWGIFNSSHFYTTTLSGTGNPFLFDIYDNGYSDNSGFLTAEIFAKLY